MSIPEETSVGLLESLSVVDVSEFLAALALFRSSLLALLSSGVSSLTSPAPLELPESFLSVASSSRTSLSALLSLVESIRLPRVV